MKVLIVAENVSMVMGGEASLPFYYYQLFRERGVEAFVACHARVRDELLAAFPADRHGDFFFVEDTRAQRSLWKHGKRLPKRLNEAFVREALHALTQRRLRVLCRDKLIPKLGIDVVLEPAPITPKGVSYMYGLGVPVAIGPMCGGMNFPPAFRFMESSTTRCLVNAIRATSFAAHRLVPGKLQADVLMVANDCTRKALPRGYKAPVIEIVESGVDLALWKRTIPRPAGDRPVRFVYAGRFVDWKGARFLIDAFAKIAGDANVELDLIGGGDLRPEFERRVNELGIADKTRFHGWLSRDQSCSIIEQCDVFVLPSLRECGGTVLLEAMALEIPIICAKWGGPANYVDDTVGIRVKPDSVELFVDRLADAMRTLAGDPERRKQMGDAGPARARTCYFDWDSKADRVLEILRDAVAKRRAKASG